MTNVAIIQARMGSSRLPGKVLQDLGGRPALEWVVCAARAVPGIEEVAIATSDAAGDDQLAEWCAGAGVACVRGSEQDVLARYADAIRQLDARIVMRLTADTPFLDPAVCGQVLWLFESSGADYASNVDPTVWADGLDCEVFSADALLAAAEAASRPFEREHVTPYLRHNRRRFSVRGLPCPFAGLQRENWALDTPQDLQFLRAVAAHLPTDRPPGFVEILRVLEQYPELRQINRGKSHNEGSWISLRNERIAGAKVPEQRSYDASAEELAAAEKTIPLGAQTFSKSRVQFPVGAAPLFLTHGDGGRSWDVDGNEYVDLVNGLLSVSLGYRDPDVDAAIAAQLAEGISFSLATRLERQLAERLVECIPCAEKVRFGKNGSDATSAAVRLARAFTGRERIISCGYHGWQDWYIGATTRHKGVPDAVRALTHTVPYNDLDAVAGLLKEHPGEISALIMEPANIVAPAPGYLAALRELLHKHGALLIIDEMITGFRFALGGAQTLFGVTPDLATFGKGMANGMPISAVVGRADIMAEMEEIFFSSTFGGEALSLAASIATIDKMRREPVIETLWRSGEQLAEAVRGLISAHNLEDQISLQGFAPWMLVTTHDGPAASGQAIKTMLIYEMAARGVLSLGSHNISYAHTEEDMAHAAAAYDGAFATIRAALDSGDFETQMKTPPLVPVFAVR
ncbi:MAG: aminotransferase class III-fold pyridoxal phosphate-dependent enzyme [Rhodospirillaceae bacterium]|nr:aminotransferase class III-fold pyridoxal phosphate-dependent enzyme [Rhodospirillaceae bacterium]MBT5039235.1 aminotransferase class III-fold pyridoxal phosphate-dependent enzyme [Rhodospirillaceae bacterium]